MTVDLVPYGVKFIGFTILLIDKSPVTVYKIIKPEAAIYLDSNAAVAHN